MIGTVKSYQFASIFAVTALFVSSTFLAPAAAQNDVVIYSAELESPGGKLEFAIEVVEDGEKSKARIVCGQEKIEVEEFKIQNGKMTIGFPHYDSRVEASLDKFSGRYVGNWTKTLGKGNQCKMKFRAQKSVGLEIKTVASNGDQVSGRWQVKFSKSDDAAVGIFDVDPKTGEATGTFQTTTGDYRYLGGSFDGANLTLSCFDGAHAFLFRARLQPDQTLKGMFWSRDAWEEGWVAKKDDGAKLPDAFKLTKWQSNVPLTKMRFPDLDGKMRSLGDRDLLGERATLIYVFGSWCPNCHDAGKLISSLEKKYRDQGLKVIGVAFELTGDEKRDAKQVKKYLEKNDTSFPVLLVGTSNKSEASKRFTLLDKIRSYPTTVFVNDRGEVIRIHTGFNGPATGKAHEDLKEEFEKTVLELIKQGR